MVKSLKFLRHRRTEAGYFSEFMIAKTNDDLENRAPPPPPPPKQLLQLQPQHAAVSAGTVIIAPGSSSASTISLYSMLHPTPAAVARHEEVPSQLEPPVQLPQSPRQHQATPPPRTQDPLRMARRRERNRAAAAKCRQRRQDRLECLAECVRQLEEERADLEAEVADLAEARAQLEEAVRSHRTACDARAAATAAAAAAPLLTPTSTEEVWLTPALAHSKQLLVARRPTSLSLSAEAEDLSTEPPSLLTTPRVSAIFCGSGSGLTPLLATPQFGVPMMLE